MKSSGIRCTLGASKFSRVSSYSEEATASLNVNPGSQYRAPEAANAEVPTVPRFFPFGTFCERGNYCDRCTVRRCGAGKGGELGDEGGGR
ncbi:MAG: hypothetical protein KKE05_04775 [Nanoarchaeota archaeon]|nr:hypothetical protein [Nanoarchaeota archaeon]